MNALVTEVYSEGGGYALGGGNSGYTVGSGLVVIRGNYIGKGPNVSNIALGTTGLWFLDNIIEVPATPKEIVNSSAYAIIEECGSDQVTTSWATKPINIFGNTILFTATSAQIDEDVPAIGDLLKVDFSTTQASLPTVNIHDNVTHAPNITLAGEAGPRLVDGMRTIGPFGPDPQYQGRRVALSDGTTWFDPEFATPAGSQIVAALDAASSLRGAATGASVSGMDFYGRIRSEKDQGAVAHEVLKPVA